MSAKPRVTQTAYVQTTVSIPYCTVLWYTGTWYVCEFHVTRAIILIGHIEQKRAKKIDYMPYIVIVYPIFRSILSLNFDLVCTTLLVQYVTQTSCWSCWLGHICKLWSQGKPASLSPSPWAPRLLSDIKSSILMRYVCVHVLEQPP